MSNKDTEKNEEKTEAVKKREIIEKEKTKEKAKIEEARIGELTIVATEEGVAIASDAKLSGDDISELIVKKLSGELKSLGAKVPKDKKDLNVGTLRKLIAVARGPKKAVVHKRPSMEGCPEIGEIAEGLKAVKDLALKHYKDGKRGTAPTHDRINSLVDYIEFALKQCEAIAKN